MLYTIAEIYQREAGVEHVCMFTGNPASAYDPAKVLIFQMKVKKIQRYFAGS